MVPVKVGDIQVEKGQKRFGFVKVGDGPISPVNVPVGIISGEEQGPILCITAGVHGSEYPGIEAATRTFAETSPRHVKGAIIIVPVVNVPGFEAGDANECPIDKVNLNRIFPGDKNGSIGQAIAYTLMEEIVLKANYLIDLHGGDLTEMLTPFTVFFSTGNPSVDDTSRKLAMVCGTEFIHDRSRAPLPGFLIYETAKRGIPAVIHEAGGLGTYREEDIARHLEAIGNVLRYLGILEGEPIVDPSIKQKIVGPTFDVRSKTGGIFYPQTKPGETISKGQTLGLIKNIRGEIVEEIVSQTNGIVRIMFPKRFKYAGDRLYAGWIYPT